jgi:hypothetical protein
MGEMKNRNGDPNGDGTLKPNSKFIAEEMVKASSEGRLVYCRFGK